MVSQYKLYNWPSSQLWCCNCKRFSSKQIYIAWSLAMVRCMQIPTTIACKKKAQVCLPITYHTLHKIEKDILNMVIKPWTFLFSHIFFLPFRNKQHSRIWSPNLTFVKIYKSTSPFLDLIITLQMKLSHSTFANEITDFPNEIQMLKITFNLSKSHSSFANEI